VPTFHLDAPAKVNLGLRIRGVRADGYHLIESLFAPLDLADSVALHIEQAAGAEVTLQVEGCATTPAGPDNLAHRAARAFLKAGGLEARVEIGLVKRTPAAAGLGGGSSDAATVLRALQRAFPDALAPQTLEAVALGLGADVPFFLDPGPAWVSGVGELREPTPELPSLALVLANPGQPLNTAEVFRAWDALGLPASRPLRRPHDLSRACTDPDALAGLLHNDLETAALRLCPAVGRVRQALLGAGALAAGLSGSGATCFGVFADAPAAERGLAALGAPGAGWQRLASTRVWG